MLVHTKFDHIISLGKNCQVATWFAKQGLMPWNDFLFNNMISRSIDGVIELLRSDQHIFLSNNVIDNGTTNYGRTIIDTKFNIVSVHDISIETTLKEGYSKLFLDKNNHLASLRSTIRTADHPLFVRTNFPHEKLEQIIQLYDIIKAARNNRPFELVIFQQNVLCNKKWNVPSLSLIYDHDWVWNEQWKFWEGDDKLWKEVFRGVDRPNIIRML